MWSGPSGAAPPDWCVAAGDHPGGGEPVVEVGSLLRGDCREQRGEAVRVRHLLVRAMRTAVAAPSRGPPRRGATRGRCLRRTASNDLVAAEVTAVGMAAPSLAPSSTGLWRRARGDGVVRAEPAPRRGGAHSHAAWTGTAMALSQGSSASALAGLPNYKATATGPTTTDFAQRVLLETPLALWCGDLEKLDTAIHALRVLRTLIGVLTWQNSPGRQFRAGGPVGINGTHERSEWRTRE